ncbi:hypothetical protein ACWGPK_32350 [Priestia megaterium]
MRHMCQSASHDAEDTGPIEGRRRSRTHSGGAPQDGAAGGAEPG